MKRGKSGAAGVKQPDFVRRCVLLLAPLGPVVPRAMFGGWGLYCDGVMFALIAHDQLYLKVDQKSLGHFEAAGSEPFTYRGRNGLVALSYRRAPEGSLRSREAMRPWGERALAAARRRVVRKRAKGEANTRTA